MAVYKVPQDVEADDKLLGPFSFKQFIFLIIAVMAGAIAFGLSRILFPLVIIPLPIAVFFLILALPLRKDQPMEIYIAAIISFMTKPKKRLWRPDGIESLIEVVAPKVEERQYGKGYSQEEVQRRLSYLANIVDSRGWAVRGVDEPDSSMQADLYHEAQTVDDPLDDSGSRAQQITDLLTRTDQERRQQIIDRMRQPQTQVTPTQQPPVQQYQAQPTITPAPVGEIPQLSPPYTPMSVVQPTEPDEAITLTVNPYPSMNQAVLTPMSEQSIVPPDTTTAPVTPPQIAQTPQTTSEEAVSPAIIDLAKNHDDLSVETLQREAQRIKKKELESEEVVISLR